MNRNLWVSIVIVVLGLLIAFIPQYIFPVCEKAIETASGKFVPMKCFWMAKAELGVGGLIVIGGLFLLLVRSPAIKAGINMMIFFAALLALTLPVFLIGTCPSPKMPCHAGTMPALIIVSGFTMVISLIYSFICLKRMKQ